MLSTIFIGQKPSSYRVTIDLFLCWLYQWFINWDKFTYMNVCICMLTHSYMKELKRGRGREMRGKESIFFLFTCFLWQQYFQNWGFSSTHPTPASLPWLEKGSLVCIYKPGSWSVHHPAVSAAHNLSGSSQCTGHHGSGDCRNSWEQHSPQSILDSPWLHRQNAHSWGGRNKRVKWGFLTRLLYSS